MYLIYDNPNDLDSLPPNGYNDGDPHYFAWFQTKDDNSNKSLHDDFGIDAKFEPFTRKAIMSTTEAASKVFEEITQLFASAPNDEQILSFRPSAEVAQRASQLLNLNRSGEVDEDLRHELDQYEQAELLMRMVKAQIHSRRDS